MIDLRAALILLGSMMVGVTTAALQLADGKSWPAALLTGGAAVGVARGVLVNVVTAPRSADRDD